GVLDISGPPTTYQRSNLTLAVAAARQIETALGERAARERLRLVEACVERLSAQDVGGLVAIDRSGRLVHAAGRVRPPVRIGERLPGLHDRMAVEDWAKLLPGEWRAEWFNPVALDGETIGAMLVVPDRKLRSVAVRPMEERSEADPERGSFACIVGASPAMLATIERARLLVDRPVPALIEGETGVGKELLARAIHGEGDARRPFVVFNCGAVTRDLVAGELFGHVRGAFTGATSEGRQGRFELAHGGILCLDEIGEMPLEVQPFLLRALEEGVVYRLGDAQPRRVMVRLIAMTNRDLLQDVAAGRFRRDLYYRIGVTKLRIPPMRDRGEDVLLLAAHWNRMLAERYGVAALRFSHEAERALLRHGWPGNARELRNVVESLLLMTTGREIGAEDLAPFLAAGATEDVALPPVRPAGAGRSEGATLEGSERETIAHALAASGGNFVVAARALGISRSTLYRKVERYGLHRTKPGTERGAGL
ncbi:MAG TPA: sigma-54 dependent transcriptional regulator, partial [Acetobacteraceae bacterium]|nr:sigma-54 dependent transcriptional regulator [Acetobacteraceae bacterium]